jgi:hypothetical protein
LARFGLVRKKHGALAITTHRRAARGQPGVRRPAMRVDGVPDCRDRFAAQITIGVPAGLAAKIARGGARGAAIVASWCRFARSCSSG